MVLFVWKSDMVYDFQILGRVVRLSLCCLVRRVNVCSFVRTHDLC